MKKKKEAKVHTRDEETDNRLLLSRGYNPEVLYLGTLCRRNHDFEKTGCSVRNRKHGYCYLCSKLVQEQHRETRLKQQAEYRKKNKEKIKENARRYREENR